MKGACIVAYGTAACREARGCIASLRRYNPDLPVVTVGEPVKGATCIPFRRRDPGGRWAKLNLETLSPFDHTLYMDADIRVRADVTVPFGILDDDYDLVMALSPRQGENVLGNCPQPDREATFRAAGTPAVLGLQAGVMWFAKGEAIGALFAAWRAEWERFSMMDQAALLRALLRAPVRLWILGAPWNSAGGAVIDHRFGAARRAA